jgi:hypothetical protein
MLSPSWQLLVWDLDIAYSQALFPCSYPAERPSWAQQSRDFLNRQHSSFPRPLLVNCRQRRMFPRPPDFRFFRCPMCPVGDDLDQIRANRIPVIGTGCDRIGQFQSPSNGAPGRLCHGTERWGIGRLTFRFRQGRPVHRRHFWHGCQAFGLRLHFPWDSSVGLNAPMCHPDIITRSGNGLRTHLLLYWLVIMRRQTARRSTARRSCPVSPEGRGERWENSKQLRG